LNPTAEIIFVDSTERAGDPAAPAAMTLPASWRIDNGTIDEEHQALLDLVNDGWRAAQEGGVVLVAKLLPMLSVLRQHLAEHFEHEEAQMLELGYPGYREHAARHRVAFAQLCSTELRLAATLEIDSDILHSMWAVLIDDILRADIPFKTFLDEARQAGSGSPRE